MGKCSEMPELNSGKYAKYNEEHQLAINNTQGFDPLTEWKKYNKKYFLSTIKPFNVDGPKSL